MYSHDGPYACAYVRMSRSASTSRHALAIAQWRLKCRGQKVMHAL